MNRNETTAGFVYTFIEMKTTEHLTREELKKNAW